MTRFADHPISVSSFCGNRLFMVPLLCVSLLAGCAVPGGPDRAQAQLESLSKEADTELSNGQRDKAVALLNQAAKESPTSAVPWLKLANISFNDGNYPAAIQAANEALQRDAANQEAKSLLVVSGLRVAANAVSGLRTLNGAHSNARAEAENLTNSLRTVLGEKVLVPTPAADSRVVNRSTRHKAKTPSRNSSRAAAHADSPAASQVAAQESSGAAPADPFKSLK